MSEHPYDVSTYWHDRAKAAEAEVRDLRAKVAAPVEVFEIVDRLNNRRVMEHVHLTAAAALDWLERQPPACHTKYRVQSVKVYAPPALASAGRTEPEGG